MKKIMTILLFLLELSPVYSLPVGNPAEASLYSNGIFSGYTCCNPCDPCFSWCDAWSLRVGYYGDFVKDRNLRVRGNGSGIAQVLDQAQLCTHAGYLALNVCDLIDVFSTLGASNLILRTNQQTWNAVTAVNSLSSLYSSTRFSWSVGARASLLQWRCFNIGIEGQYFQSKLNFNRFVEGLFNFIDYDFNTNHLSTYKEWQVGLGISYAITTICPDLAIIPYVAGKYANVHFNTNNFTFPLGTEGPITIYNLKANKHWGCALGSSFTFCNRVGVTIEGRFGDERAFYINGQLSF